MTDAEKLEEIRGLVREHDLHGQSADSHQTVVLIRAILNKSAPALDVEGFNADGEWVEA